jgi:UDP-glucose 4-epimerase
MGEERTTIAVTGACSFLGTELLKRLEADSRYDRVLALDVRKPNAPLDRVEFRRVDLTLPSVDAELAKLFADEGVGTVVHAAFLSYPTHATTWAHELEDIGTMHLLNACAVANLERFVLVSTTIVYGASAENPNFLEESAPLKGLARSRFVNDKVQADLQVQRFAEDNPNTDVCVLRFAPLLGPTVTNFFTRFFSRPFAPVMMGYDPLMQFVHESDAVDALEKALDTGATGTYNIVGEGVLPYTTILALMGKLPLPMPRFLAYPLSKALWATQIFDSPPTFLDYLRFLCVADGDKARRELGFTPRNDIKTTILDFLGVGDSDGGADIARAQG